MSNAKGTIKSNKNKKIVRWIKVSVLAYSIIGIAVYHLQEKFIFHPKPVQKSETYKFSSPHKEVNIPVDANTNYHLVQFTTSQAPKGVVLYFHGNKENIERYASAAETFTSNGYEVWMVDYPGFGKSTGEISEEIMYTQALQLYKIARVNYQPNDIIIYGRSVGTGVAAQLASIRDCKQLVLETPYYSMPSLASRFLWMYPVEQMIRYRFPTHEYLQKVTAPVTIFHGTEDGVIPYSHASQLKNLLKPADEFITIEGGSHNDLGNTDEMKTKLQALLAFPSSKTTSL